MEKQFDASDTGSTATPGATVLQDPDDDGFCFQLRERVSHEGHCERSNPENKPQPRMLPGTHEYSGYDMEKQFDASDTLSTATPGATVLQDPDDDDDLWFQARERFNLENKLQAQMVPGTNEYLSAYSPNSCSSVGGGSSSGNVLALQPPHGNFIGYCCFLMMQPPLVPLMPPSFGAFSSCYFQATPPQHDIGGTVVGSSGTSKVVGKAVTESRSLTLIACTRCLVRQGGVEKTFCMLNDNSKPNGVSAGIFAGIESGDSNHRIRLTEATKKAIDQNFAIVLRRLTSGEFEFVEYLSDGKDGLDLGIYCSKVTDDVKNYIKMKLITSVREAMTPMLTDSGLSARRVMAVRAMMNKFQQGLQYFEQLRVECIKKLRQNDAELPEEPPEWEHLIKLPGETDDHQPSLWPEYVADVQWPAFKTSVEQAVVKYKKCKAQWDALWGGLSQEVKESKLLELGLTSSELPQLQLPSLTHGDLSKKQFEFMCSRIRNWLSYGTVPEANSVFWTMPKL